LQKRRLDLGLQWKEVATEIGTHATNVANWWKGRTRPGLRLWPGVIRFIGYDPRPWDESVGGQLRRHRETYGWSRADVATHLGVTGSVLWRWEAGQRQPRGGYLARIYAFLGNDPRPAPVLIGERLKRHRERLGLTLRAMAARLGIAQATLCRWEAGERELQGEYLQRVEEELNGD
jgi:transcriptional regulator with XRE-family HTH domain